MKKTIFIMTILCFGTIVSAQPVVKDLVAGQDMVVGTVEVSWVDGDILVKYILAPGCEDVLLTETHLHIGKTMADFPTTKKSGAPKIGQFDYSREYDPGVSYDEYLIEEENLPPGGPPYMIAAHAVTETDYCSPDELPEIVIAQVSWPTPAEHASLGTYFKLEITDGETYGAWCAAIELDATYDEVGYTVVTDVPAEINCLLDNDYVGKTANDGYAFTIGDVQLAIWILMDPALEDLDDLKAAYPDKAANLLSWFGPYGTGDDEASQAAHVAQILEEVADCDMVPGCCDVMGVLLYPPVPLEGPLNQPLLIKIPAPCCETAWGAGLLFTDSTWAMYFWFPPVI